MSSFLKANSINVELSLTDITTTQDLSMWYCNREPRRRGDYLNSSNNLYYNVQDVNNDLMREKRNSVKSMLEVTNLD